MFLSEVVGIRTSGGQRETLLLHYFRVGRDSREIAGVLDRLAPNVGDKVSFFQCGTVLYPQPPPPDLPVPRVFHMLRRRVDPTRFSPGPVKLEVTGLGVGGGEFIFGTNRWITVTRIAVAAVLAIGLLTALGGTVETA